MMPARFDVVVVGGGPAGSATAILLARAGWSVALLEKQRFPRRKVCGECIAASNLPLLDVLGVGDTLRENAGPPIRTIGLMQGKRTVVAAMPAGRERNAAWGSAIGREALDTLLLDQARASGVHVLQPWSVDDITGQPGYWRCHARHTETGSALVLDAVVMIDAHGSWESLRCARTDEPVRRRPGQLLAFKGNFIDSALPDGMLPILAFKGGYGGMVKADGGITTLACCMRRDRLEAVRRAHPGLTAGDAVEQTLRRDCAGVDAALANASRAGNWLASGPLRPGIPRFDIDQPFLVGNAAGEAHPIIGEGMSMALQSAFLLSECLLRHRAAGNEAPAAAPAEPPAAWQRRAGHAYYAQWRMQFAPRLRLAAAFAQVAMRPLPARLLWTMLQRRPALLSWGAARAGKVECAVDPATISAWAAFRSG